NLFTLPNASASHSTKYPLIWPLQQGTITLLFGPCSQVFEPPGFGYAHFHTGVDVAYKQGSPILAADDGIVVGADTSVLNGQLVGPGDPGDDRGPSAIGGSVRPRTPAAPVRRSRSGAPRSGRAPGARAASPTRSRPDRDTTASASTPPAPFALLAIGPRVGAGEPGANRWRRAP